MSNGDPPATAKDKSQVKVRRRRSAAGGRFKVDAPLLVVILLFGLGVGGFIYRELRRNPLGLQTDVYPLHISATYVEGVAFGSQLRCQGFVVGRVRTVLPETGGEKLAFRIEARIDPAFSRWRFEKEAVVRSNLGPAYLGQSAIELTYAGTMPVPQEQYLMLRHERAPGFASLQTDAPKVVAGLRDIVATLNKPVSELAKLDPDKATAAERIIINFHDTAERISHASAELTEAEEGAQSTIERIQGTVVNLQQASRDLREASAKSIQLEEKLTEQVDSLSREMHLRLANIEYSALQILGERPSERLALGRDIRATVANLRSATGELDDLIPRIGDTFLGRLLIRRDKKPRTTKIKTQPARIIKKTQPARIVKPPPVEAKQVKPLEKRDGRK